MPRLIVCGHTLSFNGKNYSCAIGKGGFIPAGQKREGDGCTPLGTYPLRECWYRADKLAAPATNLPLRIIYKFDGWCDDPVHPLYNKHFVFKGSTPPPAPPLEGGVQPRSFEHLWREDDAYDLIIPLGYNDGPIIPNYGSAIFLHVAKPDYTPTEGCVALAKSDLIEILPHLTTKTVIEIKNTL